MGGIKDSNGVREQNTLYICVKLSKTKNNKNQLLEDMLKKLKAKVHRYIQGGGGGKTEGVDGGREHMPSVYEGFEP